VIRVRGLRASSRRKFSFAASATRRRYRASGVSPGGAATDEVRARLRRMRRANGRRAVDGTTDWFARIATTSATAGGASGSRRPSIIDWAAVIAPGDDQLGSAGGAHSEDETR